MTSKPKAPPIPEPVLNYIERLIPELQIKPGTTMEEIQYHAGQQSVLRELRNIFNKQQKKEIA